jgi:DNA-binding PadR family transcriptional regulator
VALVKFHDTRTGHLLDEDIDQTAGYLTMRQESAGRRRKLYALTDAGRTSLREWAQSLEISESQVRDEGTLKIFAGADPRVVFTQQREWRARKLAEMEGYLQAVEASPENEHTEAIATTLRIGVGYERMLLDAIDSFLADG